MERAERNLPRVRGRQMIYLDHAATTPLDREVFEAMSPFFQYEYGNPQSQHAAGRAAANAVVAARDGVARTVGCAAENVVFVSGGTEAGNTAVKGVCARSGKGHLVISEIEHPCVYESALDLTAFGFEVTFVKPDGQGVVRPEAVRRALRPDTVFCAVMAANNETGVLQPVEQIGALCRERGVFYYCDCVQTAGSLPLPMAHCDGLGISAHKLYGPKGAGALCLKSGSRLARLISGGRQERGLRGGTLNAAGAVGLSVALQRAAQAREQNNKKTAAVRDRFLRRVFAEIGGVHLNGGEAELLPSHANLSFEGCDGENILFALDLKGVAVSTGSACSAGAVTPSRVIAASFGEERAKSAVRFTFGKYNTEEEADRAAAALKEAVEKIRSLRA